MRDAPADLQATQHHRDIIRMLEQMRIDHRRGPRIRTRERHTAAALWIQPDDADRVAVTERKRKRIRIAARGLEDDLNIRPWQIGQRANETRRLEDVAGQRAGTKQRVLKQTHDVSWRSSPGNSI